MEADKLEKLHSTLMKLAPKGKVGGLGYASHSTRKVGRDESLPNNPLYNNFVRAGSNLGQYHKKAFDDGGEDGGNQVNYDSDAQGKEKEKKKRKKEKKEKKEKKRKAEAEVEVQEVEKPVQEEEEVDIKSRKKKKKDTKEVMQGSEPQEVGLIEEVDEK